MEKPYVHQEYPKWRYHAAEKAQIVRDPAHEDEAAHSDEGWVNHPSQIADPTDEDEVADEDEASADSSDTSVAPKPVTSKKRKKRVSN